MGEEEGIRSLVSEFYRLMDELPEAKVIRELHPEDLTLSIEKLGDFLIGWSGGPPVYQEKYGHPRLRMRHMPFPIGDEERDQWMLCMRQALESVGYSKEVVNYLEPKFSEIADFMRNQ